MGTSDGGAVSITEDPVNDYRFYLKGYSKTEGLTSNHVTDICIGSQGDVWMTTFGGGVSVLCRNDFYKFPFPENLENISPQDVMFRKNGDIWITTSSQGLFIKKGDSLHHLTPDCGMHYNNPSALCEDDSGNVWIGIDGAGMLKFTGDYFHFYSAKIGLNGLVVKDLHFDSKNRLWVATQDSGVFCLHNNSFSQFSVDKGLLCSNYVRTIYEQKDGNIWFCTAGGGITRFDGENIIHYTEREGLPGNDITDIREDSQGNLWIATAGAGVARLSDNRISQFSEGLTSGYIRSVLPVSTDSILLGTERGIAVIKLPDPKMNSSGFRNSNLLAQQGLSSEYINTRGIHIDNEGSIWALTATGIDIKNSPVYIEYYSPVVKITECFINNGKINFHSDVDQNGVEWNNAIAFYNVPENMKLKHFNNSINFHFSSGISFFNKNLEYSYLLVGYDDDWSPPVSSPFAEYKELPFGEYEFKVRVRFENGQWSSPDVFSFYILPPWWHTWWARILYILLALIFLFSIIRWRTASLKKRQSELEKEISMATMEIRKQKDEVEQQKEIIEFAHSDIKSSILYAKRIQNAILPSPKIMLGILSESFVLYLPKDIVAGDFYWMEQKDNQILLAAADCTGHGVPGAMVSVVCNNALNRAVREFGLTDPGKILDKTREIVISEFEKSEDDVKDGMDISLVALTHASIDGHPSLQWAGANNPLWIINPFRTHWPESMVKGDGWAEARPDKQPIGKYSSPQPFTTYSVDLQKGDTIYIFTDGFQDQFGGEKGKKYKAARLKSFLISIVHHPLGVQKELLLKEFEQWRDTSEQVDDVCVIGVRL
jgi:serine phosphatase RsbU (regulator of sigma subunit)/streptogramin lyase